MKIPITFLAPLMLCSCAGDLAVTRSSPPQPTRTASISGQAEVRGAPLRRDRYAADRVYLVTRPGTADEPRGEWRTRGGSIRESGLHIEFVELNSGRNISFDAPHQVTPTPSGSTSAIVEDRAEPISPTGSRGTTSL